MQTSIKTTCYPAAVNYLKFYKKGKVMEIFKVLKTDK